MRNTVLDLQQMVTKNDTRPQLNQFQNCGNVHNILVVIFWKWAKKLRVTWLKNYFYKPDVIYVRAIKTRGYEKSGKSMESTY